MNLKSQKYDEQLQNVKENAIQQNMQRTLQFSDSVKPNTGFSIKNPKLSESNTNTSNKHNTQYGLFGSQHQNKSKKGELYQETSGQDFNPGVLTLSSGHKFSLPILLKEK